MINLNSIQSLTFSAKVIAAAIRPKYARMEAITPPDLLSFFWSARLVWLLAVDDWLVWIVLLFWGLEGVFAVLDAREICVRRSSSLMKACVFVCVFVCMCVRVCRLCEGGRGVNG